LKLSGDLKVAAAGEGGREGRREGEKESLNA